MAASMKMVCNISKPICVILGATGAGKSKLALEIATQFGGEIISADSMQVYQKLDIVTNKVTKEERDICAHHLIDCVSPLTTNYTVVQFRNTALPIISDIHKRNKLPIIVGGTNYYIEALLWNMLIDSEKPQNSSLLPACESNIVKSTDSVLPPVESVEVSPQYSVVPSGECTKNQGPDEITLSSGNCAQSPEKKTKLERPNAHDESKSGRYEKETTSALFKRLQGTDPDRAKQIHPHDRRKILRSLEVFEQTGLTMSEHLKKQHGETEQGSVSGPLRYSNPCVIWVQSDQSVLDERTDRRVDQMISEGLLQELKDFHRDYNNSRLQNQHQADYTLGIFQSIGFKEFHEFLILSDAEQATDKGQHLLAKGVEEMKRATRQYARRQTKWMINRFLKRRGSEVPLVYGVDSTDASKWQQQVHDPAVEILSAYLQGRPVSQDPLPVHENQNLPEYNNCSVCDLVFLTSEQWRIHLKGRRHKKSLQHQNHLLKRKAVDLIQTDTDVEGKKRIQEPTSSEEVNPDEVTT